MQQNRLLSYEMVLYTFVANFFQVRSLFYFQPFSFSAENNNGKCEYNGSKHRLSTHDGKSHMRTN